MDVNIFLHIVLINEIFAISSMRVYYFYVIVDSCTLTHLCPMLHKRNEKFRHSAYNEYGLKPLCVFTIFGKNGLNWKKKF